MKRYCKHALGLCGLFLLASPATGAPCTIGTEVVRNFDNGTSWELCWNNTAQAGLGITDAYFLDRNGNRRKVIKSLGLGALAVSRLDSPGATSHVYGNAGGIGDSRRTLTGADCPGGSASANACVQVINRGYASKYYGNAVQGQAVIVSSASDLATGSFIQRFLFADDGTIRASLGHGGALNARTANNQLGWPVPTPASSDATATAFSINALWRINLQLGDSAGNESVEMLEAVPSADRLSKTITVTPMTTEFSTSLNPDRKRAWRVVDRDMQNRLGLPASYELTPVESGQILRNSQNLPWTQRDLYATRYNNCEIAARATTADCSGALPGYVNGQSIDRADVVLWYRTTLYRLPASEDRTRQRVQFMGFDLVPRDWTTQ